MTKRSSGTSGALRRGFIWLVFAEIFVRGISVVTTVGIARLVGPEHFGQYVVAVSLLAYAAVLGDAGLTLFAQREIVVRLDDSASRDRVIGAVLIIQVAAAVSAAALICLAAGWLPIPSGAKRIVWIGAPILLAQAFSLLYVLQAFERMRELATLRVVAQVIGSLGGLVVVVILRDVALLMVATWAGMISVDLACWRILRMRGIRPRRVERRFVRETFVAGAPMLLNALTVTVLLNADVLAVGIFSGSVEAGVYGAAYRIAAAVVALAGVAVVALFPKFVKLAQVADGSLQMLLSRVITLGLRFTLPLAAIVMFSADAIIAALFGQEYAGAPYVLRILFLWVPLGWLSTFSSQALLASGQYKSQVVISCASAVLLLILLGSLVKPYGAVGAATAVVIAEAATAANFLLVVRTKLDAHLIRVVMCCLPYLLVPGLPLVAARLGNGVLPGPLALLFAAFGIILLERRQQLSTWRMLRG